VAQTLSRLDRIQTLVFVMMENRSFDHMLGYLRNSRPEVEGLQGGEGNHVEGYTRAFEMRRARGQVPTPVTKRFCTALTTGLTTSRLRSLTGR